MEFSIISQESPYYPQVFDLRNRMLRVPLGLQLADEDTSQEVDQFTVIISRDEKVIACLMLQIINPETIKLRQMAVEEGLQRAGLGSLLIGYAENFCVLNNYFLVELHARKAVCNFYSSLGYVIVGEEFEEVGIPHFKMQKNLRREEVFNQ